MGLFDALAHHTALDVLKWSDEDSYQRGDVPYDVYHHEGNILTSGGVAAIWNIIAGGSTTLFNNANGYVGVGDSSTASTSGMTDLQASTNKLRRALSAGSPGLSGVSITFQAIFGAADANFAWWEFGVFNASTSGTMLNRVVSSGGTKPSGQVWAAVVTISLG